MRRYTITVNDATRVIDVEALTADTYRVVVDGRTLDVRLDDHRGLAHAAIAPTVEVRGRPAPPADAPGRPAPAASGIVAPAPAAGPRPREVTAASAEPAASGRLDTMTAPMPGVLLGVLVHVGQPVARGDAVAVLEAMKMKNDLRAPRDGVVAEVYVAEGQRVAYGEPLLRFEGR